ncbi:MAG: cytochrome c3 family protein [Terriglobia bacterium]
MFSKLAATVFCTLVFLIVQALPANAASSAHYVGSKACEPCHPAIYARWKKTPMANVVRDPRTHLDAIVADFSKPNPLVKFTKADIALVYGSIWKQRYFKKVGNNYYVLPAQWDIAHGKWLPYFVGKGEDWWAPLYPPDNMKRPTGPLCDGCHSVNYDISSHAVTEWNVGCERCHGPGSEHVRNPAQYLTNIINPARLDYVNASDVCIQCHVQGRPLKNPIGGQYYDWPVGFQVGLHLQDAWKLEQHKLGVTDFYYFPDGTAHKNRMQGNDYVQSLMYRHGVTCFSCHDVHGTENAAELIKPVSGNQMCLECHSPGSPNGPYTSTIDEHTHHQRGSPGSECVSCHMPKIEKEGVPGAFVHVHTFRFITPAMTERYDIPNPCISCHKDKSNQWATQWLRRWFSPWRMEGGGLL